VTQPEDADFTAWVEEAVESLPAEFRVALSNLVIEIEDEDPQHPGRLGLYQGVPLTRRTSGYLFALPDRITIYRRSLERFYGYDREVLRERVRHTVLHEVAHHFGISDERLREIGRY
jgi:predicted Zn-dependent protease with MMP-like domain